MTAGASLWTGVRLVVAVAAVAVLWVSDPSDRVVLATAERPVLPGGFAQEVVASGLEQPTAFAFLPDGRILIAEKTGVVRIWKDGRVLDEPFLDLHSRVNAYYERGLLGLTVDPHFEQNGYVYLLYTYENDATRLEGSKVGHLSRFTARGDTAPLVSEHVLLGTEGEDACSKLPLGSECIPQDWYSHAVGQVRFATDGSLFVSTGEAAPWEVANHQAFRALELDSLGGKLLRISPDGDGLPTNPFWNGDASANRSKVWAYGLRNPFRFALQPGTDVPYVGDVGWGDAEELDASTPGANLGWPCYEGSSPTRQFRAWEACRKLYAARTAVDPVVEWQHPKRGATAIAGGFYTDGPFPARYRGALFYADFIVGFIGAVWVDDQHRAVRRETFASGLPGLVQLEQGPDGALYILSLIDGELRRIVYRGT